MILKSVFTMLANNISFLFFSTVDYLVFLSDFTKTRQVAEHWVINSCLSFNKFTFICRYDKINSLEDLDVKAGEYIKSYMIQTVKNINEQAHVNEKELIDVQRRRYFLTVSGVISYIVAFALGVSFFY